MHWSLLPSGPRACPFNQVFLFLITSDYHVTKSNFVFLGNSSFWERAFPVALMVVAGGGGPCAQPCTQRPGPRPSSGLLAMGASVLAGRRVHFTVPEHRLLG